ncbi:unnamed protein product [Acanthoscelides obtectus]|uniref:Uncharacterized protein n=1 Tax=Acanthoscelides obtectus TaxID=200917 RepID=A0A9P0JRL1_ACAOB|nr:unnamed protein product [Acanthoscelides obtectus]CAK1661060.1 hypothetical protein AOBTE_LOCUS22406 [Acanthoscelides obtectus]
MDLSSHYLHEPC